MEPKVSYAVSRLALFTRLNTQYKILESLAVEEEKLTKEIVHYILESDMHKDEWDEVTDYFQNAWLLRRLIQTH